MRNNKRKRQQPSLEAELKRLASQKIAKDPKGRTRAELLAASLWNKSLSGDRASLQMLLERLPVSVPQSDEPSTAVEQKQSRIDQVVDAFRALTEAGIVPVEVFEKYRIKQFDDELESKNPDWNKTLQ